MDGWGRYTVELVRSMRARGIEPVLVTAQSEVDPCLEGIERHAILHPPLALRFDALRSLLASSRLKPILATCDLVHCLVEPYLPLVARTCPDDIPFVQTAHGTWAVRPFRRRIQRLFYTPALRRVGLLVFQSHYTQDRMGRLVDLPRSVVLPGGVRAADFERAASVKPPTWLDDDPIVLSVGALKERKGHPSALRAVGEASKAFPRLQFVIVGNGGRRDLADRLRRQAAELGLANRFHILGEVPFDELVGWYLRASAFMLLPVNHEDGFEGFGLAYLEAGAAGKACIATSDCGAAEAVVDGVTGILVSQSDASAASQALVALLENENLRISMGEAGRQRAHQLSWDNLAAQLCTHYESLANSRSTVGAQEQSPVS
jgi:glycosyltransferase involved in cell wall biosynthesis